MAEEVKKAQPKDKILAYCVKTKEKGVKMIDPTIVKTSRGGYMAKGKDKNGNGMVAIMSEQTALDYIKAKVAKKGF